MYNPDEPALVLAPMEGIADAPMRAFLGEVGRFSYAVAPFVRVSAGPVPPKVFLRDVPELGNAGKTPTGLPVQVQILGGDPDLMAESALNVVRLGARCVDLNFGCPAKTVNRHDGGAALLKEPRRIGEIVRAVRSAVPPNVAVSAKIRLGWENPNDVFAIAEQALDAGAAWLTVHARTRVQGYQPPAQWQYVGALRRSLDVPVIANGDIWNVDDLLRCQDETGCQAFMLGRGSLADPLLSVRCAHALGIGSGSKNLRTNWREWVERFLVWNADHGYRHPEGSAAHIKEWLRIAWRKTGKPDFERLRKCRTTDLMLEVLGGEPEAGEA